MRIYFIGIGGSSMSSIARLLSSYGHTVQGSDRTETAVTKALSEEGIAVRIGHDESVAGMDAVVYTCGVPSDNPQLVEAAELSVPVFERAEMLGLISLEYGRVIAVAGTHGKTTTAALIAHILEERNPTLHIGAQGSRIGGRELFVTEACEYRNSFLALRPDVSVILNIECDHPDFYRTPAALSSSFTAFASCTRGTLFLHDAEMKTIGSEFWIEQGRRARVATFGSGGDYAFGGATIEDGCASFDVYDHGEKTVRLKLSIPGWQLIPDALAAAIVARGEGMDWEEIRRRTETFRGVERRWQSAGSCNGAEIILDYAHHPTQINAAIDTAAALKKDPIVVFQPHTYSRTRALFHDYTTALSRCGTVIVTDIYAAREARDPAVSALRLAQAVAAAGGKSFYAPTFESAAETVRRTAAPDNIVLILGAGDVTRVADMLAQPSAK